MVKILWLKYKYGMSIEHKRMRLVLWQVLTVILSGTMVQADQQLYALVAATINQDTMYIIGDGCERCNSYCESQGILSSRRRAKFQRYSQVRNRTQFKLKSGTVDLQIQALQSGIRVKVEIVKIMTRIRLTSTHAKKDKRGQKANENCPILERE